MLVEPIRFTYEGSEKEIFRGTRKKLDKKLEEGYQVVKGGNGSYLISKPSVAEVTVDSDVGIKTFDVKNIIREEYGLERVTEASFKKFEREIKDGKKKLSYTENEGLTIQ